MFQQVERLRREHGQLVGLVQIDELTGLYNFRHLTDALEKEVERTRRTGLPTALIMLDLDRFKEINDTYGHETGNAALRTVAATLRGAVRKIDVACRYGGEEFTLILPGSGWNQALAAAERLRTLLACTPVETGGRRISVTASIGVDVLEPRERLGPAEFLERADRYLLEAKAGGRNCVRSRPVRTAAVGRDEREALDFDA